MLYVVALSIFASRLSCAADITSDLVGHWKLGDGSGSYAVDATGNGLTGTLTGTEQWATGKIGGAFDFNQASHFSLGTSDVLNLTTTGTVAAWINPDDPGEGNGGRIFARHFSFYHTGDNGTGARIAFGSSPSINRVDYGVWSHVAVTWSGTAVKFYINGTLDVTRSGTAPTSSPGTTATLGDLSGGGRAYDGRIDDVRVYSRALSADDIHALYVQGGPAAQYYHLQQQ